MSECAVLASITKNPTRLNPVTHPENNASRRSLVLQNMLEQHYITKKEYREALSDDVYTRMVLLHLQKKQQILILRTH